MSDESLHIHAKQLKFKVMLALAILLKSMF